MSEDRLVYTAREVQELLGLSRTAVYDRLRDGTLPSVRVGARILIPRRSLERFLERAESREAGSGTSTEGF